MDDRKQSTDTVFHERISYLRKHGYRGFTVSGVRKEWDGLRVTAENNAGRTVSAGGETDVEAYDKLIDIIDEELEII